MAKDPAINWYFDNWCGGTKGFSRHQKGCYIDLLEAQFYLGQLSLEQVKNILGPDFNQWNFLKEKFTQDEQGKFFNERLDLEKNKRLKFSMKQIENGKKGGRPRKPTENPNLNPAESQKKAFNGTGIETENDFDFETKGGVGEIEFPVEKKSLIAQMLSGWMGVIPDYPVNEAPDYLALGEISKFIRKQEGIPEGHCSNPEAIERVLDSWRPISKFVSEDDFFKNYSLGQVSKHIQNIVQKLRNGTKANSKTGKQTVDLQSALSKLSQMSD